MKDRCINFILVVCALLLSLSFPSSAIALDNPIINEFLSHPGAGNKEWVEFYNPDKVDLTGFFIDDDKSFSEDIGGSKKSLVNLLGTDSVYPYIELTSFLNNDGDFVVLFDTAGNIVDEFEYSDDLGADVTMGRSPDGNGDFFALAQSTQGSANSQPQPTPTQIPTNTPVPTNTPKPPTPTKIPNTPTSTRTPTPTKTTTLNQKNTPTPTLKLSSKKKISISPTKISSKSATLNILGASTKSATLTPSKKALVKASENKSSSFSPLIFSIVGAALFLICAILVALKIKWKQRQ